VTVRLRDRAVSTSGDAEQFLVTPEGRFSHLIDPRTGWALRDAWAVTVIARSGVCADAYASALGILGPETGSAWLARQDPEAAALFCRLGKTGLEIRTAGDLASYGDFSKLDAHRRDSPAVAEPEPPPRQGEAGEARRAGRL
jgi:thiamine biosynthesis lipoprotein ApbE